VYPFGESTEISQPIIFVTTEAGLYIKELISGDKGRTQPNLSELLQNECVCKELDVVKIHLPRNDASKAHPTSTKK